LTDDWQPAPPPVSAPPVGAAAQSAAATGSAAHSGARCGVHADRDARFTCARCGTFGCADCLFGGEPPAGIVRIQVCLACAEGGLDAPIPWERRKELGIWRALVDTTKLACGQPTRFFRTPAIEKGSGGAILYGVAVYGLAQLLTMVTMGLLLAAGGAVAGVATEQPVIAGILGMYGCAFVGFSPFFVAQGIAQSLMALVIGAGASHGTLLLMKRSKVTFEGTLRVMGYSYAPFVWMLLPGCGGMIAYVWMLVIELKGLRETHQCGTDGAALAVFGYRALLFLLVLAIYGAMIALFVVYMPGPRPGGGFVDPSADYPAFE
jgi:hypothetical protein